LATQQKLSQYTPVIPATQEVEAEGYLKVEARLGRKDKTLPGSLEIQFKW
jgi:hypothetical protein